MNAAMETSEPDTHEIDPVDIQRLLLWYFESEHPGRPHIRRRSLEGPRSSAAPVSARV